MDESASVNSLFTLRLLWGAFVAAIFLYNVIARLIPANGDGVTDQLFFKILIGLSAVELVAVLGIQMRLGNSLPADLTTVFVPKLFQFALAEAIAVSGLVIFFLDGNAYRLMIFSAAALVGLLIAYPKR